MAKYDMTSEIHQLMDAGYTEADLDRIVFGRSIWHTPGFSEAWASNRTEEYAIYRLIEKLEAKQQAATITTPMVTEKQVDFITSLLVKKARSGEGDGFASFQHYIVGSRVDQAALRKLTRQQASQLITSLKGEY